MPIINVTLPSDGTTADVADYNSVITAMLATINGLLDDDNIASLNGSKIIAGTLPITALSATAMKGWNNLSAVPNSITSNGNKIATLVFNSLDLTGIVSPGMLLRGTNNTANQTQCTNLSGSTQYFVKTSPNKMTFTDDFAVSIKIKPSRYTTQEYILTRWNGTSGWTLGLNEGVPRLIGYNGGSTNYSLVQAQKALPLNEWSELFLQLDMSAFSVSSTTSYVMINGEDVPAIVARSGTNPTALVQAGNLEIGGANGGTNLYAGKAAQAAVFNAKVTQATAQSYSNQGYIGNETSLASAWSLGNSLLDLNTTTPNDLTAQGSATTTNADAPWGLQADGTISGTLNYAEILQASFSTNTTLVVRMADNSALPSIGTLASIAYSTQANPHGFPGITDLLGEAMFGVTMSTTSTSFVDIPGMKINVKGNGRSQVLRFTFNATGINISGAGSIWTVGFDEDGNMMTQFYRNTDTSAYNIPLSLTFRKRVTAGDHTYKVRFSGTAGTLSVARGMPNNTPVNAGPGGFAIERL